MASISGLGTSKCRVDWRPSTNWIGVKCGLSIRFNKYSRTGCPVSSYIPLGNVMRISTGTWWPSLAAMAQWSPEEYSHCILTLKGMLVDRLKCWLRHSLVGYTRADGVTLQASIDARLGNLRARKMDLVDNPGIADLQ